MMRFFRMLRLALKKNPTPDERAALELYITEGQAIPPEVAARVDARTMEEVRKLREQIEKEEEEKKNKKKGNSK